MTSNKQLCGFTHLNYRAIFQATLCINYTGIQEHVEDWIAYCYNISSADKKVSLSAMPM